MSTAFYTRSNNGGKLGKNQDVPYAQAYFFLNPRGVAKTAAVAPPHVPLSWDSIYGSVTVSQVGLEWPNGGMNEAGLVVEQTTLWQSDYPESLSLPSVGELQWIQYMLDTCPTVEHALEAAGRIQIVNPMSRLHYILCDRSGNCAILEFMGKRLNTYSGKSLSLCILANTPYPEALKDLNLQGKSGNDSKDVDDYDRNSTERFVRTAELLGSGKQKAGKPFVFGVLKAVRRADTAFSLVYDPKEMTIDFAAAGRAERGKVMLEELDFAGKESLILDMHQALDDRFSNWIPYTAEANRKIVKAFFRDPALTEAFGWRISEEVIEFMANLPASYPRVGRAPRPAGE